MVLDGKNRFAFDADAFVGAVEERHMALDNALGQRFAIDDETVVLAGNLDFAREQILDGLVAAAMAHVHLVGLGAQCER